MLPASFLLGATSPLAFGHMTSPVAFGRLHMNEAELMLRRAQAALARQHVSARGWDPEFFASGRLSRYSRLTKLLEAVHKNGASLWYADDGDDGITLPVTLPDFDPESISAVLESDGRTLKISGSPHRKVRTLAEIVLPHSPASPDDVHISMGGGPGELVVKMPKQKHAALDAPAQLKVTRTPSSNLEGGDAKGDQRIAAPPTRSAEEEEQMLNSKFKMVSASSSTAGKDGASEGQTELPEASDPSNVEASS